MKIKFVEATLISEVDKNQFDLQMKERKKKWQVNVKSWSPETILKGKGYHLYMLKLNEIHGNIASPFPLLWKA